MASEAEEALKREGFKQLPGTRGAAISGLAAPQPLEGAVSKRLAELQEGAVSKRLAELEATVVALTRELGTLREALKSDDAFRSVPKIRTAKNWGVKSLPPGGKHWTVSDKRETEVIMHTLADESEVGITTLFWLEAGRGPVGRYHCDTMIIRCYVDNETNASLTFTPSMVGENFVFACLFFS